MSDSPRSSTGQDHGVEPPAIDYACEDKRRSSEPALAFVHVLWVIPCLLWSYALFVYPPIAAKSSGDGVLAFALPFWIGGALFGALGETSALVLVAKHRRVSIPLIAAILLNLSLLLECGPAFMELIMPV